MTRLSSGVITLICGVLGLALVVLTPHVIRNNYSLSVLNFIAINTILVVGLNLLMGYAGQVSLGHAAFYGMGAYATAILTTQYHVNPWLAMLIGIVFTSVVALLVGIPCLRLKGHYLAMATLGFGWIVYIVMLHWSAVTQGTSGIDRIPKLAIGSLAIHKLTIVPHIVFGNDTARFYLLWVFAVIVMVISANIVNSRMGRALRALHSSESAAAMLGVNVSRHKVMVFVLSAAYASLAGSLYAHTVNFISPSTFGFIVSVELVVMVVVGGMASIWGALIGASTIYLLVEWLRSLGEAVPAFKEYDVIAHGAILVLVMIFMPTGLVCGIRDLAGRWFRHRKQPSPVAVTEVKEAALK